MLTACRIKHIVPLQRQRLSPSPEHVSAPAFTDHITTATPSGEAGHGSVIDSVHRIALAEFQKEKHHNGQIKNQHNGRLPVEQDIESFLIQGAERVRLQKRRRDDLVAQMDDQRDFFPSIATDAEAAAHDDEAMRVNLDLTNSGAEEHLKWNTPLRSCYLPPQLRFDAPTTSKPEPTGATNHKAIPRMHDQEEQEKKFAEEIKKKLR